MLMANAVSQLAAKTPGKEAAAMEAFAAALRQVNSDHRISAGKRYENFCEKINCFHEFGLAHALIPKFLAPQQSLFLRGRRQI